MRSRTKRLGAALRSFAMLLSCGGQSAGFICPATRLASSNEKLDRLLLRMSASREVTNVVFLAPLTYSMDPWKRTALLRAASQAALAPS